MWHFANLRCSLNGGRLICRRLGRDFPEWQEQFRRKGDFWQHCLILVGLKPAGEGKTGRYG